MMLNGTMDGDAFLAYVRTMLAPALKPGDILVMDNLSSHRVSVPTSLKMRRDKPYATYAKPTFVPSMPHPRTITKNSNSRKSRAASTTRQRKSFYQVKGQAA